MNIKKESVGFSKNINKDGLLFHYNIRADIFWGVGHVPFIRIPCRCSDFKEYRIPM